ncbi:PREDICTED: probable protein S-acyltransferase 19 isoform X2 [Ipomoea nil]|uniref:probable protein S-acyltransferase 19 isoform X2 n=1 Tax=Ipomoea nil TaxID=35883 RepID=UPI000901A9C5|nr:PREDICTED: probable protein S-acyltransferase 19 isoform X2 [Ipomoea nil]
MVRKHGWQLPAHTFQVVAITVFCLLVVAFYTFFAPFLGGRIWEYALLGAYSPVALLVFFLYVRCTAINPADPGIMSKFDSDILSNTSPKHGLSSKGLSRRFDEPGTGAQSSPSSVLRSPVSASNSGKRSQLEAERTDGRVISSRRKSSCSKIGGFLCVLFVHRDCRGEDSAVSQQEGAAEDALFCTLCNAEVRKFSKHCRSCDKCVDGFDHHCGLAIEAAVGIAVFVRCFVSKRKIEAEIVDRLGNGFSRAPFASVVAVCTVLSLLACVPLGELFFFHMILIRKGLTTYEYVVAMRAMSDGAAGESVDEEPGVILYSPSGSATTGLSGGSSLGLQYKGAWCTPPRVFVDYQEEVAPQLEPGMVPSTVDPDAIGSGEKGNKAPKRAVKISAWKLARLDSSEAMKAAAKARESSSVLRPIDNHHSLDPDLSTSENTSVRSSMSADTIGNKETRNELRISPLCAPSQGSRDEYETGTQSMSSFSSPSHAHGPVTLTAIPPAQGFPRPDATTSVLRLLSEQASGPGTASSNSATDPLLLSAAAPAASLLRDIKRTSVVWDQEAGRYVSVPLSAAEARNRPAPRGGISNPNAGPTPLPREPSKPAAKHPVQQSEKLTYTGESIFFGGPLFRGPEGSRNGQERLLTNVARESRFKRDATSLHQLPVFVPGDHLEPNVSSRSGLR